MSYSLFERTRFKLGDNADRITDRDMYIFLEKGARVGTSYISNRQSKVINTYLKFYDPKKESRHVISLGGNKMTQSKWTDPKEYDLSKYISNSSKGCFFEVDLEYPKE